MACASSGSYAGNYLTTMHYYTSQLFNVHFETLRATILPSWSFWAQGPCSEVQSPQSFQSQSLILLVPPTDKHLHQVVEAGFNKAKAIYVLNEIMFQGLCVCCPVTQGKRYREVIQYQIQQYYS